MGVTLGIDLGTQSLKVVVCEALAVRGAHGVAYPTRRPEPDRAEQDPADWEAALGPAIAGALATANARHADVVAVAITGQLDGCVAVDASGEPLHPALIWQDRRAVAEILPIGIDAATVFAITGQVADPGHLAPKLAWLRARGIRAARWHGPTTYLTERLTGSAVMDHALASTTMLYDLAAGGWSRTLLAAFAIDPGELPELRAATALAGTLDARGARLTGLAIGTPVAVGTGDDFATPLGAGLGADELVCTLGTAEVVGARVATALLDRAAEPMVETHVYPGGGYFIENPGWLSGGAIRWATRMLGLASDAELDALAAAAPPGAAGVTFVPALAGAMTPVWRPHATGTFHGLAAGHDRAHLARAVLEGLAFACRDVVERLASLGVPARSIMVLGGGAASAIWTQLRADILGRPHHAIADLDTCAFGAAMIAMVATEQLPDRPDLATLAARVRQPGRLVTPDASTLAVYDAAYRRYQRLTAALAPLQTTRWIADAR